MQSVLVNLDNAGWDDIYSTISSRLSAYHKRPERDRERDPKVVSRLKRLK